MYFPIFQAKKTATAVKPTKNTNMSVVIPILKSPTLFTRLKPRARFNVPHNTFEIGEKKKGGQSRLFLTGFAKR